jgi:carboxypeptidase Q
MCGKGIIMRRLYTFVFMLFIGVSPAAWAQQAQEPYDSAAVARIRDEGMNNSHVMEFLSYLTDVYGPRLTGSPGFNRAAEWARHSLASMGLANAHLEAWGPFGRSWELKHYSAHVLGRQTFPLISYPKAWSVGSGGTVTADLVYFDAETDSAALTYRGKLKGKFVLLNAPREILPHFEPEARRSTDSTLLELANAPMPTSSGGRRGFQLSPDARQKALVEYRKLEMCRTEGAVGILSLSRGDGGNIFVQQISFPVHPDTPFAARPSAYKINAPSMPLQIAVGAEHYNRLVRMIGKGEKPKLQLNLDVNFVKADSSYNIIAEFPGTDRSDEVVMIGAHFDSWHGGTGATDNGTGSAVCMEAMRILKALDLKPRRTIRIGLWGGEEQGLLGSRAYVKRHLGERDGAATYMETGSSTILKPETEKFSVYFNNDNGSGRVRGVYLQGNDAARSIFRSWLAPFKDLDAQTLSLRNTGGTDHLSFDAIGLPGFQFIQDEIEYSTRTHHSTMDVYDRAVESDLRQAAIIMATFAYNAAMREEKFPRKEVPVRSAASSQ